MFKTILLVCALLSAGVCEAANLTTDTIFGGDVIGTWSNLRLRVPVVGSSSGTTTTVINNYGGDITDIDANNITIGILPNARLDASSVTLQGNIFNVSDRLLKILTSGYIWNDLIDNTTWISTNTALGADLSGFLPLAQVVDDSHNHSQISVTGFTTSTGTTLEIAQATTTANVTLLSSSPTLSGTWTFLNPIAGSITGNAGTVTNGVYTNQPYSNPSWITYIAPDKLDYSTITLAIQNSTTTSFAAFLASSPTFSSTINGIDMSTVRTTTTAIVSADITSLDAAKLTGIVPGAALDLSTYTFGGGGGGNAYTNIGVVGQIPYYVATDSIAATGIQPSQILTSTNPAVARTNVDNNFSAVQTFLSSATVNTISDKSSAFEALNSTTSNIELLNIFHNGYFSNIGVSGAAVGNSGSPTSYRAGVGLYGAASGTGSAIGVIGISSGSGVNYGLAGSAYGVNSTNYGVYGQATGGTINWAGYFDGNIYVQTGVAASTITVTGTSTFASTAGTGMSVGANTAPTMKLDLWCGAECYGLPDGTSGTKGFLRFRGAGGYSTIGMDFGVNGSAPYNGWIQARDIGTGYVGLLLNPLGGNVGVGAAAPNYKLHVSSGTLMVDGTGASVAIRQDNAYLDFYPISAPGTTANVQDIRFLHQNGGTLTYIRNGYDTDATNQNRYTDLSIVATQSNSKVRLFAGNTETLTVEQGQVGINKIDPAEALDVNGNIRLSGGSTAGTPALIGTRWGYSASYPVVLISTGTGTSTISLGYDPSGNADGSFTGDGREILFRNGAQFVTPNAANNAFFLQTLVLKDGNVGVNNLNPTSKLHVSGAVVIDGTGGSLTLPVTNYNGNAFAVPIDLALFEMSCRALRGTGTDTSVAIKTSGTTSCSAACTATTSWPNCDNGAVFQDPGGAADRVRMQNVACATSDANIKYCCCH